ncbi:hypothetical protein C454_04552 [Haloferax gibbonsii ATCC 33959]|uniref:Uncharacterized protein n=1 Tax=Haloferax gibbonsii (strain ATCC 33959 / DSM 4427 / JCM 8863 / NBRC 102184 / NCIMB 2188 / Ma 2.38) TaxID=1227459 RepID=M0HKF2_HALGM|nr:hypothetical protein [Haloferax gibbonsii]ELZ83554.1 hypothetical protein C454_04552 [Haloferax gibbonsii ATCC 33959]
MAQDTPAERRLLKTLGEEVRIPILNIEEGDLYPLVGFPIVGIFIAGLTGIDSLLWPLGLGGLCCGLLTVYATPSHRTTTAWLSDLVHYYLGRPSLTTAYADTEADATGNQTQTFGDYNPFVPTEQTQDLTNIAAAWPGAGALERTDGTMVGMVELNPSNMDFAMSGDWAQRQHVAETFANNELDFPLVLHATTRPFPVDRLIDRIDDRLTDEDVTESPAFERLLTEYRETRPEEMAGTQEICYYLGVEVDPFEVYSDLHEEDTPLERLTALPLVGVLLTPFVTRRERLTEAEVRARLFDAVDTRCRTLETELIGKQRGWAARRLSTTEQFLLSVEFWNGAVHEYGDPEASIRTAPALGHSQREETDV